MPSYVSPLLGAGLKGRLRIRRCGPLVLLFVVLICFFAIPPIEGTAVSSFSVYNALQDWAAYGLVALGLGLTMIAGEFDISVLGTFAVSGMIAVLVGNAHGALVGVLAALGVAVVVGLVQGLIIARLGINSMPVTLGAYIALLGWTSVLGNSNSVSFNDFGTGESLDAIKLYVLSWHSLITVGVVIAAVAAMRYTRVGRDVRAVGGDRRASRAAGVNVTTTLVGVFIASSLCAALAGTLLAFSLATAVPDPGLTPLTYAATAVLLGGVGLTGGTGSAVGIAIGGLALSFLDSMFSVLATPQYVSDIVTGALLVAAVVVAAPDLVRRWRILRSPHAGQDPADSWGKTAGAGMR
jgi:ribose transport system permease protein